MGAFATEACGAIKLDWDLLEDSKIPIQSMKVFRKGKKIQKPKRSLKFVTDDDAEMKKRRISDMLNAFDKHQLKSVVNFCETLWQQRS